MASVKLTFNSVEYKVLCQTVQVGWKNNVTAKPKVNGGTVVEAQTHSFENPTYTLQGVQLTEESGTLTYQALLQMAKNRYDGTNKVLLTVDYGVNTTKPLVGSNGTSTNIPVVITGFSFPINASDTYSGSNSFYLPALTITLQETA